MTEKLEEERNQRKRGDRWLLISVLLLFLVGIGVRSYGYLTTQSETFQQQTSRNYTAKTAPDTSGKMRSSYGSQASGEQGLLPTLAPYLTEGGFSFFLGFCIGYVLRLVAKATIFIIGAIYCGLILLSHYEIIAIDWGSFQQILQQILLNTQPHIEGLRDTITGSLPSVAMGGLGIWRGMKKS